MNTKLLSERAISTIDQYEHFSVGKAVCQVPYFNNRVTKSRANIRTLIGKGSPKDIYEEIMSIIIKNHADQNAISDESLKRLLTDNNIGIDCSGFAYYVLNAETKETRKGPIDKHIHFTKCNGIIGKMRCALRPVENCDVQTFADDKNSKIISMTEVRPGDIITMLGGPDQNDRDHILLIFAVDYQNFIPTKILYTHAIAYPEDGVYGTGIKKGTIEIMDNTKNILEQKWTENGKTGVDCSLLNRALKSKTELRRLNIL